MPTNFLAEDQVQIKRKRYGRFTEIPDEGPRNRLGWAIQLGTLRYLGTLLDAPEDVPDVVVDYVAEQLGLSPAAFAGYGAVEHRWDHQEQIREAYGYTKFGFDQWFSLARWLYQRAWTGSERPTLIFDLATKRLLEHQVLLPGVTTPWSGWSRAPASAPRSACGRRWRKLPPRTRRSGCGSWSSSPAGGGSRSWTGCGARRVTSRRAGWSRRWCVSPRLHAPRPSPSSAATGAWPPWWRSPR